MRKEKLFHMVTGILLCIFLGATIPSQTVYAWEDMVETEEEDLQKTEEALEYKLISIVEKGYRITVMGNMPSVAGLRVYETSVSENMKEDILRKSNRLETWEDLLHTKIISFDISICVDEEEYEPYEYDENMEVYIEFEQDKELRSCDAFEVFHVTQDGLEVVNLSSQSASEIAFCTDSFSQFVFVGEMNYEKETLWEYSYTGEIEYFTAPTKGIYKIDLYGAQGENYGSFHGGNGGHVSGYIILEKGEMLKIQVGGTLGYSDGGVGTLATGGGRTVISKLDEILAIAGGGGAAGLQNHGEAGGMQNGLSQQFYGESNDQPNSSGGGAGFLGGNSGVTKIHNHIGDEMVQGGCYQETESRPVEIIGEKTCNITAVAAGMEMGLCDNCGSIVDNAQRKRFIHSGCGAEAVLWIEGFCTNCNEIYESGTQITFTSHNYQGPITVIKDFYILSCGYEEDEIESFTVAYGGSNYIDENCFERTIREAGVSTGNGKVKICLEQIEASVFTYFDDLGNELTKSYVEPGEKLDFPLGESMEKQTDEKYSYQFLGWDDLATQEQEIMSNQDTVGDTREDHSYQTVYKKIPREYQIVIETGVEQEEKETIRATYEEELPILTVPCKKNSIFDGYYTLPDGKGQKVYDAGGNPVMVSDFTKEQSIYANWINPIEIVYVENDTSVMYGYGETNIQIVALANPSQEYELRYEWYQEDKRMENTNHSMLQVPTGLKAGEHAFYCRVYARNIKNDQEVYLDTKQITLSVEKGYMQQSQIHVKKSSDIYSGKDQTILLEIEHNEEYSIYYGITPLDEDNYLLEGSLKAPEFCEAGKYQVYLYVISRDYQPMQTLRVYEIKKATPVLELKDHTVLYDGNSKHIAPASCLGVDKKSLDIDINYEYYTDEEMTQLTQTEHGAKTPGTAPANVGRYYVKASVEESKNYEAAKTTTAASFTIEKRVEQMPESPSDSKQWEEEIPGKEDFEEKKEEIQTVEELIISHEEPVYHPVIMPEVIIPQVVFPKENLKVEMLETSEVEMPIVEPVKSKLFVKKPVVEKPFPEFVPSEKEKAKRRLGPFSWDFEISFKGLFITIILGLMMLRILYGIFLVIFKKRKEEEEEQ